MRAKSTAKFTVLLEGVRLPMALACRIQKAQDVHQLGLAEFLKNASNSYLKYLDEIEHLHMLDEEAELNQGPDADAQVISLLNAITERDTLISQIKDVLKANDKVIKAQENELEELRKLAKIKKQLAKDFEELLAVDQVPDPLNEVPLTDMDCVEDDGPDVMPNRLRPKSKSSENRSDGGESGESN